MTSSQALLETVSHHAVVTGLLLAVVALLLLAAVSRRGARRRDRARLRSAVIEAEATRSTYRLR